MKIKNNKMRNILRLAIPLIIIIIGYCTISCMPLYGAEKECDISDGGSKVCISGRDIWYNIFNEESEETPVYVIAGGTGFSSDYMEDSLIFLAETHPVIFYDGRCAGRSEYTKNLSSCTFENYAEDLEALRKYLTPDKDIIIAAHSYGGATAFQYAADYGDNIESMILISSVGLKTSIFFSDAYFHIGLPPLNQDKANKWYIENINATFSSDKFDCSELFSDSKFNYALMMKNNGRDKYDFSDELADSDIPALILVGGENDTPITDIKTAEQIYETFKNSEIYQFEKSGHFCFAEEYDAFREKVSDFLNK